MILGVIAEITDSVMVLYAGRVAEIAPVRTIFDAAAHPYTEALLGSVPDVAGRRHRLISDPRLGAGRADHAAWLPLRAALPATGDPARPCRQRRRRPLHSVGAFGHDVCAASDDRGADRGT